MFPTYTLVTAYNSEMCFLENCFLQNCIKYLDFFHTDFKDIGYLLIRIFLWYEGGGKWLEDEEQQKREDENNEIKEMGTLNMKESGSKYGIQLLTIIGEIEGHDSVSGNTKATKYEHLLPRLAQIEEDDETDGVLILLNTLGGDVEAGLAIAEMIASLSKPTVSLVLGGSHSIGGPLAVSADYSFIVPTGTMIVHPVRSTGMFIGVMQSYRNMEKTQDRITKFIASHSNITQDRLLELMLDSSQLVKDVGTMLEGEQAVKEGMIDEVGGIKEAFAKLHSLIDKEKEKQEKNLMT